MLPDTFACQAEGDDLYLGYLQISHEPAHASADKPTRMEVDKLVCACMDGTSALLSLPPLRLSNCAASFAGETSILGLAPDGIAASTTQCNRVAAVLRIDDLQRSNHCTA